MLGGILALVVGVVLGATLIGAVFGVLLSVLMTLIFALTIAIRRDWVPVIYNVRSLGQRRVTTAVTVAGLTLVVFVVAALLMLRNGVRTTLAATGDANNAKIIRKASQAEMQSSVTPENLRLVAAQPEVMLGADGKPLATAELVVLIFAQRVGAKDDSDGTNLSVRGVGPLADVLHKPVALEGRNFRPGTSEIVIGRKLVGKFEGAQLNGTMKFARRDWTVVGVMNQGGSAFDSEVWGDVEQMLDAFQRRPTFSSITMRLKDPSALKALEQRMANDPQLNQLEIKNERKYWESQSEQLVMFITFLGAFVALVFTIGAVLGAMITMYAQVAARTREIGALRAMGFRRRSVLVSFVVESTLLGLLAGGLGLIAASFAGFIEWSTVNFQTFSEVTFRFRLDAGVVITTLLFAAIMGFAGGLLPALRAAMLPITRATRGG